MQALFGIGFVLILLAAAVYLITKIRAFLNERATRRAVDATLNPPEARIAKLLGDARRSMPPDEFARLKTATFAEIERLNKLRKDKQ